MTITNQTLMWLAPLGGAAAMTVTTLITGYFDSRRPKPAGPVVPDHAAGGAVGAADPDMDNILSEIAQRIGSNSNAGPLRTP